MNKKRYAIIKRADWDHLQGRLAQLEEIPQPSGYTMTRLTLYLAEDQPLYIFPAYSRGLDWVEISEEEAQAPGLLMDKIAKIWGGYGADYYERSQPHVQLSFFSGGNQ